jgi:hypothetical protein
MTSIAELAFLKRDALRKAKRCATAEKRRRDNMWRIDHICQMYEHAYFAWTGQPCKLRYNKGWYYIPHKQGKMHEQDVIEATNRMLAYVHEEGLYPTGEGI